MEEFELAIPQNLDELAKVGIFDKHERNATSSECVGEQGWRIFESGLIISAETNVKRCISILTLVRSTVVFFDTAVSSWAL